MCAKRVLAVDFGTSNSYFCKCPSDELIPSPIDLFSDRTGIETAVLYREGKSPLIGSFAVHTWGEASERERRGYSLKTRFKPEIDVSPDAFDCSIDFLSAVRDEATLRHVPFDPLERDVYFGVPCEASVEYVKALMNIAEGAGYGSINTIPEPIGALLFHLSQGDIAPSEAMKSVLVVDFGGGTCDAALMSGMEIVQSWGDWTLGGRLFDDLFYQILLDRNEGLEEEIKSSGTDYFVHWYWSRRLKESFSSVMARDRIDPWSGTAGVYGAVKDLSWGEFESKARAYSPTEEMNSLLRVSHPREEDLLARFDRFLSRGRDLSPHIVIMAGGSSLWPFVSDIIYSHFPEAKLVRSDQPYGVVAKGLAIFPALKRKNESTIKSLKSDMRRFLKEEVKNSIMDDVLIQVLSVAVRRIDEEVFQSLLLPSLRSFREKGGALGGLRDSLESDLDGVRYDLNLSLREDVNRAISILPRMITDRLGRWFSQKGVKSLPLSLRFDVDQDDMDIVSSLGLRSVVSLKDITDYVDYSVAILSTAIVASICGGSGLALIATGIPGLIVGGSVGLGGYLLGRKRVKKFTMDFKIPSFLAKTLFSDKAIASSMEKGKKELEAKLKEELVSRWNSVEPEVMERVKKMVEREINALSMVNQIDSGRIL